MSILREAKAMSRTCSWCFVPQQEKGGEPTLHQGQVTAPSRGI